jgi:hypothetical protein
VKILFDHGTPAPLRRALIGHVVSTTHEMGWSELDNGSLYQPPRVNSMQSSQRTKTSAINKALAGIG